MSKDATSFMTTAMVTVFAIIGGYVVGTKVWIVMDRVDALTTRVKFWK
jgi:hypothetical protein